jgi:hypothetical protein
MQGLSAYVSKEMASHPEAIARQDILTNFQHAFGAQGRRIATLFSDPKALQQFQVMQQQFEMLASNGAIQDIFVKQSVSQQYQTALTNFQNAMIELGYNLLPLATSALNEINHGLEILIPWMREHKELVKDISYAFIGLAGAMAFGGTVALLISAFTGLKLLFVGILAVLSPLGGMITALSLALYGLYKVVKLFHLDDKAMKWVNDHVNARTQPFFQPTDIRWGHTSSTPVQVHTQINMDGKKVADAVSTHQSKMAGRPPVSTTQANPNASLIYPNTYIPSI